MQISSTDVQRDNIAYFIDNKIPAFKEPPTLRPEHKALLLKESGFTDEVINQLDWFSCTEEQAQSLMKRKLSIIEAIAIPYRDTKTGDIIDYRLKLIKPIKVKDKKGKKKTLKYLQGKGTSTSIYYNRNDLKKLHDSSVILYICEGEKKAESLRHSLRLSGDSKSVVVSIPGCWNWGKKKTLNDLWRNIAFHNRVVHLIPDSDFRVNKNVLGGWTDFARELIGDVGAIVRLILLQDGANNKKRGTDDYYLEYKEKTVEEIEKCENFLLKTISDLDKFIDSFKLKRKFDRFNDHFYCVGNSDQSYFFYLRHSRDIVSLSSMTPINLYRLAPKSFWDELYSYGDNSADLAQAASDIYEKSRDVGAFDPNRIRGRGVWLDKKRVVVNTGSKLIVDNLETNLDQFNSKYFYVLNSWNYSDNERAAPSTREEGNRLLEICSKFKWHNISSSKLLLGWIFISRVAGSLPIRPHVWITGSRGTGKSTLLEKFVDPAMGYEDGKLYALSNSTEAGLRQSLKFCSIPIVADEFEITQQTRYRINSIIEMFRGCWSSSNARAIKGSAGGTAQSYTLNSPALVSSIGVVLENDADRSRFSVLELDKHDSNPETALMLEKDLSYVTPEMGERFFARACLHIDNIIECSRILKPIISIRSDSRAGDQIGTLLAGYWMATNDKVIAEDEANSLVEDYLTLSKVFEDREEISDEQACLTHLLTQRVNISFIGGSVAQIITKAHEAMKQIEKGVLKRESYDAGVISELISLGIKVKDDRFFIANRNAELSKLYRDSKWCSGNWGDALKKLPEAQVVSSTISFGGRDKVSKSVSFPLSILAAVG